MTWSAAAMPAALLAALACGTDPHREMTAMAQLVGQRFTRLTKAIDAYHAHPYRRDMDEPPTVWHGLGVRLLDFGLPQFPDAPPLLIVPSLINRHYVLDLRQGQSFVRWLAAAGLRPMLIVWDDLQASAETATVEGCITNRLEPALASVRNLTGQRPFLLGYCLGGLLTAALAARRPNDIRGHIFMATPWDFHSGEDGLCKTAANMLPLMEPLLQTLGALPIDAVQMLFYALDPFQVIGKFLDFSEIGQDSEQATAFVALEDWLNDGLAMPAPIARTLLGEWHGENTPALGAWNVAGQPVQPQGLPHPALVLIPLQDRIVPPASALALGDALPHATILTVDTGHIGMVSSRRAPQLVWEPLLTWVQNTIHAPTG
jgi:polyhydroxyalkanoate synthase subunit PhaC